MSGNALRMALTSLAAPLALGACATMTPPMATPRAETIAWSVGPCFGFCPVYSVAIAPDGLVTFDGERHTAMLGRHVRRAGPGAYRTAASTLAAYRPATGATAQTTCEQQISDQSVTRIVWTAADGTTTTLEHNKGCRSARNDMLNGVLQALPRQIGIEPWSKQVTRPGVSRG